MLHPLRDNLAEHLYAEKDGRLAALMDTGTFQIARLRLNLAP
jgi:hypothetical protein